MKLESTKRFIVTKRDLDELFNQAKELGSLVGNRATESTRDLFTLQKQYYPIPAWATHFVQKTTEKTEIPCSIVEICDIEEIKS